jgi:hypothetical protein
MKAARLLVWMVTLLALLAPPAMTLHAATPAQAIDCPDHALPPSDPCPDRGTARHAAGDCCPLMAGTMALLPEPPAVDVRSPFQTIRAERSQSLAGQVFSKDPPPPRV